MKVIIFFIFCLFELSTLSFGGDRYGHTAPPGSPLLFSNPINHASRSSSQAPFTQDDGLLGWRESSPNIEASSSESFLPLTPIPQSQYTLTTAFQIGKTSMSGEMTFSDPDIKYADLSKTLSTLDALNRQTVTYLALSGILDTLNAQAEMGSLSINCDGPLSQYFYEQLLNLSPRLSHLTLNVWMGDDLFMRDSGFINFLESLPSYTSSRSETTLSVGYPVEDPASPLSL